MASRSTKAATSTLESMDKLTTNTLKRNPKMELSKTDLLKLLSFLEGELQAREIVIATLKAEKVKQLLHQVRLGGYSLDNPLVALERDAFAACSPGFDEVSVRVAYSNQLLALETLMDAQRCAHHQMKEQLENTEQRHAKIVRELEEERHKHAQDTAQGDDVTYLLEKERERLKQEVELERQQNKKLEKEFRKVASGLEQERMKQKQIVLLLLAERKRVMMKFLEEKRKCGEIEQLLQLQKGRMADMVDGLEEESQKSLQMEAELEEQIALFEVERTRLREAIAAESVKSQQLQEENENLSSEVESLKQKTVQQNDITPPETDSSTRISCKPSLPPALPTKPNSLHSIAVGSTTIANTSGSASLTSPRIVTRTGKIAPVQATSSDSTVSPLLPGGGGDGRTSPPSPPPPVVSTVTKLIQLASSPGSPVTSRPVQGPLRSIAMAPTTTSSNDTAPPDKPTGFQTVPATADHQPSQLTGRTPGAIKSSQTGKVTTAAAGSTTSTTTQLQQLPPPQPPKKPVAVVRGTPPPVPPNKPVLMISQTKPGRSASIGGSSNSDSVEVDGGRIVKKLKIFTSTKEKIPQSDGNADGAQVGDLLPPTASMDLLGQELADFQQLLVSMVAGKGIEILSTDHISPNPSHNNVYPKSPLAD